MKGRLDERLPTPPNYVGEGGHEGEARFYEMDVSTAAICCFKAAGKCEGEVIIPSWSLIGNHPRLKPTCCTVISKLEENKLAQLV